MEINLNLPGFKLPTPPPPVLAMDEYFEFMVAMYQENKKLFPSKPEPDASDYKRIPFKITPHQTENH